MRWVLTLGLAVALLDQGTKWLVVHRIEPAETVVVIPGFFQLVNWRNTGAAWGMFRGANLVLAVISVATLAALILFRRSLQLGDPVNRFAVGLIAGGIVGNLIDRVRVGSVIDFLDFDLVVMRWPAFNVADSAICVGVGLYILRSWWTGRRDGVAEGSPPAR